MTAPAKYTINHACGCSRTVVIDVDSIDWGSLAEEEQHICSECEDKHIQEFINRDMGEV